MASTGPSKSFNHIAYIQEAFPPGIANRCIVPLLRMTEKELQLLAHEIRNAMQVTAAKTEFEAMMSRPAIFPEPRSRKVGTVTHETLRQDCIEDIADLIEFDPDNPRVASATDEERAEAVALMAMRDDRLWK